MTASDAFLTALRQLHEAAGRPSSRVISKRSPEPISHTTVQDILMGRRLATWGTTSRVVITLAYLADDKDAMALIHDLWRDALTEQRPKEEAAAPTAPTTAAVLNQILQELRDLRGRVEALIEISAKEQGDLPDPLRSRTSSKAGEQS